MYTRTLPGTSFVGPAFHVLPAGTKLRWTPLEVAWVFQFLGTHLTTSTDVALDSPDAFLGVKLGTGAPIALPTLSGDRLQLVGGSQAQKPQQKYGHQFHPGVLLILHKHSTRNPEQITKSPKTVLQLVSRKGHNRLGNIICFQMNTWRYYECDRAGDLKSYPVQFCWLDG